MICRSLILWDLIFVWIQWWIYSGHITFAYYYLLHKSSICKRLFPRTNFFASLMKLRVKMIPWIKCDLQHWFFKNYINSAPERIWFYCITCKSWWMACPTSSLPFIMLLTSFCTKENSLPEYRKSELIYTLSLQRRKKPLKHSLNLL